MIKIIAAIDKNRVLGDEQGLVWNIPEDMVFFKHMTLDHIVLMGRKTYETIGKALPNRLNIILTKDKDYKAPGCMIFTDIQDVICWYNNLPGERKDLFIIGGAKVYQQFLQYSEHMILTEIQHEFKGTIYFPVIDFKDWKLINSVKKNYQYELHFNTYIKI